VLLVRARTQAPARLERLLVPLDCTAASEAALNLAAAIAQECKAALNLAVVVPTVETVTGDLLPTARLTPISTAATLNVEEQQSRDYLAVVVQRLGARGVRASGSVLRGETIQTLAEAAEQIAADLIVIATHGRAGLDATFTGSVAAGLIGRVTQPVLMIKI